MLALLISLTSCKSKMIVQSYNDDYNFHNAFKGGIAKFDVDDDPADVQDDIFGKPKGKATLYCQPRVAVEGEARVVTSNYTSYVALPTATTSSATVTNNTNSQTINISGNSSGTQYVPIQQSKKHGYQDFICADPDRSEPIYVLFYSDKTPPKCLEIPSNYAPGEQRINNLVTLEHSKDCRSKEGWISYFDKRKMKDLYFYVGKKGLEKCLQLEEHLIKNEVTGVKIEYASKQFAKCIGKLSNN